MKIFVPLLLSALTLPSLALAEVRPSTAETTEVERAPLPRVKGVIRRIDSANARLSIKHDAIPNLDMPAMTMTFAVQDRAFLNGLTVGSRILFSADEVNGVLTVVWLQKQP